MKTVNEFVEKMVKIEWIEQSGGFGHYPFQMFVEKENDERLVCALALGGNVAACFREVKKHRIENSKRIYISLDYPEMEGIEHDFVAVFSVEDGKENIFAIPYNPKTGQIFEAVKEGAFLEKILSQFKLKTAV